MRLLNIDTLELKWFPTRRYRPRYVIASHRWTDDEITYEQFCNREKDPSVVETAGYKKVLHFCEFVRRWRDGPSSSSGSKPSARVPDSVTGIKARRAVHWGPVIMEVSGKKASTASGIPPLGLRPSSEGRHTALEWIWIDTCCIDKRNSTELQEGINSMFGYYADSYACLAYLADVRSNDNEACKVLQDYRNTTWFTRGWTLQELIAPSLVIFLNREWEVFGHKGDAAGGAFRFPMRDIMMPLNDWITQITGIPKEVLSNREKVKDIPVKNRLEWAVKRDTTRDEDQAYCLLGICDVFMPMIYGEGDRAFDRLEDAINREARSTRSTLVIGLRSYWLKHPHRISEMRAMQNVFDLFGGGKPHEEEDPNVELV